MGYHYRFHWTWHHWNPISLSLALSLSLSCSCSRSLSLSLSLFFPPIPDAIPSADQVRITPSLRSQRGSVWTKNKVNFEHWQAEVTFRVSGRGRMGADGLVRRIRTVGDWVNKAGRQPSFLFGEYHIGMQLMQCTSWDPLLITVEL